MILSRGWSSPYIFLMIAPMNIGLTNTFSFGEETGLELNCNFGFNIILSPGNPMTVGYFINPVLKFRYKSFSVGIDVTLLNGSQIGYLDN